jgi:GNAT superfamily N-acetyltransferase
VNDVVIRAPRPTDSAAIASLMGQLGYPAWPEEIPARLKELALDAKTSAVWVAELDGQAVGIATAKQFPAIHQSTPVVWLTALVVAESARGRGVGTRLVNEAEEWAREQGARKIALTSALHRDEAHDFYKRLGYEHTGVRLAKVLS